MKVLVQLCFKLIAALLAFWFITWILKYFSDWRTVITAYFVCSAFWNSKLTFKGDK